MNDVELYTKNLTIRVQLDGYDDKDFDVAIEAGDNRKVITVTAHDVKRLSIDKNLCKIEYILLTYSLLTYSLLDDIKVTCKYPVVVRYNDVIFCKTIEPMQN